MTEEKMERLKGRSLTVATVLSATERGKFLTIGKAYALALGLTIALCNIAVPAAHAGPTAYAITNGGTTLISFDVDNPNVVTTVGNFNGANSFLNAIDFRPLTGQLYGYSDSTDSLYTVDLATAGLSLVASSTGPSATNTSQVGADFNPRIDRVRVVTGSEQNLVYNPNTNGVATVATNLAYASGDVNDGVNPNIIDNAYNNNVVGTGLLTTTQYGIDYGTDTLVTIANNFGTLNTVGALGVDTDTFTGFDIFTSLAGVNSAYAILDASGGNAPGLYSINLSSGTATSIGAVGGGLTQVSSLAISPSLVPEAGTIGLMLGGIATVGAGFLARRRRSA